LSCFLSTSFFALRFIRLLAKSSSCCYCDLWRSISGSGIPPCNRVDFATHSRLPRKAGT
jgi:hypothetical protein